MANTIGKEPASKSDHGRQQIVAMSIPEAGEAQDANGEIGVGHLVLEGTVGPADLLSNKGAKGNVHDEHINAGDAQHPKGDPKQRGLGPSLKPPAPSGLQGSQSRARTKVQIPTSASRARIKYLSPVAAAPIRLWQDRLVASNSEPISSSTAIHGLLTARDLDSSVRAQGPASRLSRPELPAARPQRRALPNLLSDSRDGGSTHR